MFVILPLETWQIVLDYSDFSSQITLKQVCKYTLKLKITNYQDICDNSAKMISDEMLHKNQHITKLCIRNNFNIVDINYLLNLQELDASGYNCCITDSSIKNLTMLTKLNVTYNKNITNIS